MKVAWEVQERAVETYSFEQRAGRLFHQNVREKLKDLLDRKRTSLPFVEESTVQSAPTMLPAAQEKVSKGEAAMGEQEKSRSPVDAVVPGQLDEGDSSRTLTIPEWRRTVSREKRYAVYEAVKELRKQGFSHYAIADTLGISRPTVRRFLAAEQVPERLSSPKRQRLSSQQASWLFVLPKEKLTAEQQRQLEQMCQASQDLSTAYELSQDFLGMLKERRAHELKDWIRAALSSQITELKNFAKSVQQDYAAISAACSLPWSHDHVA